MMDTQKYLVIIRGKGTAKEQRIPTTIPVYWSATHQRYMTIPTQDKGARA